MRMDLVVHHRLREPGLVAFVVAVAAITDEVEQHVALEFRAIRKREPCGRHAGFGIVRVDVNDRNLEPAGEAAGIQRTEQIVGVRRESDLIVGDDVNRAAGRVARQLVKVQRLGDDALAGKRRVTVNEDRQDRVGIERRRSALARGRAGGARHSLQHRIDRLEMTWVRRHRHEQLYCFAAADRACGAEVIFDVAGPVHVLSRERAANGILEFRENLLVWLAENVRHHVQAAAVRHTDKHLAQTGLRRLADHDVEDRNEHVESFDRESRLSGKRPM